MDLLPLPAGLPLTRSGTPGSADMGTGRIRRDWPGAMPLAPRHDAGDAEVARKFETLIAARCCAPPAPPISATTGSAPARGRSAT